MDIIDQDLNACTGTSTYRDFAVWTLLCCQVHGRERQATFHCTGQHRQKFDNTVCISTSGAFKNMHQPDIWGQILHLALGASICVSAALLAG